ncbi:hypothetical protein [Streptomyces griseus]|uniref:hypothetical protein n=1 Tax=Streptomyces griseus TaxID=1911 RepID=UPI00378C7CB6
MADERGLLDKFIHDYERHSNEREEWFRRNLRTYDPDTRDQPCADWEMGEYDDKSAEWAFDAEKLLSGFVREARIHLEGKIK